MLGNTEQKNTSPAEENDKASFMKKLLDQLAVVIQRGSVIQNGQPRKRKYDQEAVGSLAETLKGQLKR